MQQPVPSFDIFLGKWANIAIRCRVWSGFSAVLSNEYGRTEKPCVECKHRGGKMRDAAAAFIDEVKSKTHLNQLLKDLVFSICLKAENERIPLSVRNGEILMDHNNNDEIYDAIISGPRDSIQAILTGKEKLRDAMRWNDVTVTSTFRKLLFLESLFYLSKPRKHI
jgi:hypothetical protein